MQASLRLPSIRDVLKRYDGQHSLLIHERYTNLFDEWTGPEHLGKFDSLVEAAVDLDQLQHGEYIIAAGYDSNLQKIRSERDQIDEQIQKIYQQAANDLNLPLEKALKLDKTPQWGHVFRITKKEEPKVRKKLVGACYVTLETRKDGVKFTNTKLRRCSEQYSRLSEEYVSTQRELVGKVVEVASTFLEVRVVKRKLFRLESSNNEQVAPQISSLLCLGLLRMSCEGYLMTHFGCWFYRCWRGSQLFWQRWMSCSVLQIWLYLVQLRMCGQSSHLRYGPSLVDTLGYRGVDVVL